MFTDITEYCCSTIREKQRYSLINDVIWVSVSWANKFEKKNLSEELEEVYLCSSPYLCLKLEAQGHISHY